MYKGVLKTQHKDFGIATGINDLNIKKKKCKHRKQEKESSVENKNYDFIQRKRKKTISFSNDVESPIVSKVRRETTPYKVRKRPTKLEYAEPVSFINFDISSSDSSFSKKESNCDSEGMTDSSFVSFVADESSLVPSTSELVKNENYSTQFNFNINQVTRKNTKNIHQISAWNSLSPNCSDPKTKKQEKQKKFNQSSEQKKSKLDRKAKIQHKNKRARNLTYSKEFQVDEIHFDGNIKDPLQDYFRRNDIVEEIPKITIPNITYEIVDVGMNIWDNVEKKSEESDESYAEFCSTLDGSIGNASLEDSVFASDIYSQDTTSFSPNDPLDNIFNDVEEDQPLSLSNNSNLETEEINTLELDNPKMDSIVTVNGLPSSLKVSEQCNGFIKNLEETRSDNNSNKEDQTAIANFIQLDGSLIIVIKPASKLYFHGLLSVTVLQGAVKVLGYKLTPSSKPAEIYSPRGTGYLFFESVEENNIMDINDHPKLKQLHNENSFLEEMLMDCQPYDAIIYCETFDNPNVQFIEDHLSQSFFPKVDENGFRCIFQDKIGNWDVFEENLEWEGLNQVREDDKVLLCGGKGVGKSTVLRYCINSLLMLHKRVLVIDLDPGQPEFTLPACVSAIIIDEPIFGPNYTQIRKTERSFLVPNIDVGAEPEQYLSAVTDLINYTKTLEPMVTFVNYMGYSKGIGVNLIAAVITLLRPTVVVQIESKHFQRNFRQKLRPQIVEKHTKLFLPSFDGQLSYLHFVINSVTDDKKRFEINAKQIREMRILGYFGSLLPTGNKSLSDTAVPVYEIDLSTISIVYNKKVVPPMVANGNLVTLCRKDQEFDSYVCIGWGIVRAIDLLFDKLYLITPLLDEELEFVDVLNVGSVFLPSSVYLSPSPGNGLVPYIAQGILNIFGEVPKRIHDYNKRKANFH